jgi:peptide/nickel transport system permease protein
MLAYVVRRLIATVFVMTFVAFFVFSLLYLTPGDPAATIAGDRATADDIARIHRQLGLDDPFLVRFGHWAWGVLQSDLGTSIFTNLPVTTLIGQRVGPTVSLTAMALIITLSFAIPLGVIAASKVGSWIDRLVMVVAVLGFSMPSFVLPISSSSASQSGSTGFRSRATPASARASRPLSSISSCRASRSASSMALSSPASPAPPCLRC